MVPVPGSARRSDFELLFATVYEPLQRYLRRRTDASTAEDVLGDVLLVLWRRIDDVPAEAPLAWAYGVARGCLANNVRGAARQERLVRRLAAAPGAEPAPGADPDPDLNEALLALPVGDREVLWLWAWEQLPPREIALVLGITGNAASIRLHRASGKLKQELAARKDARAAGHLGEAQGREEPR